MFFRVMICIMIVVLSLFFAFDYLASIGISYAENNKDIQWAPDLLYYIARLSFVSLKYDSCILAYRKAAKLYPRDSRTPEAIVKIGKSYERKGQYEKALSFYNYFKEKYPDHIAVSEIQRSIDEIMAYDTAPIEEEAS